MADGTGIEWADASWNPIIGCSHASEGCENCYAERMAIRMNSNPKTPQYWDLVKPVATKERPWLEGMRWAGVTRLVEQALDLPLSWRKPRRVFVCSMADLFHESVTDAMLDRVFAVMALARQHTFLLLTKRPERMREYMTSPMESLATAILEAVSRTGSSAAPVHPAEPGGWPLPNVWAGITAENQRRFEQRARACLLTPAARHFVSYEPALGSLVIPREYLHGEHDADLFKKYGLNGFRWVIAGGETGPNARPAHPDWFRQLRDQCEAAAVPFMLKSWGEWVDWRLVEAVIASNTGRRTRSGHSLNTVVGPSGPLFEGRPVPVEHEGGKVFLRVGKAKAGRLLDGREHLEIPAHAL